jgi:hypothetical protein
MKINRSVLSKMIQESIKRHLLREWGDTWNYPGDSDFRSDAPWNQSDPVYDTDEDVEFVPSIPMLLVMVEYGEELTPEIVERVKQVLSSCNCPQQMKITVNYSREILDSWPDEDGFADYEYGDTETEEDISFVDGVSQKLIDVDSLLEQNVANVDSDVFNLLKKAYDDYMDCFGDYVYPYDDYSKYINELKGELQKYK